MIKEQTLTAEEFLRQGGTGEEYIPWIALRMEQYAQYRERKAVLEALEREIPKAFHSGWVCRGQTMKGTVDYENGMEYYEIQVKPRYQNKDE